MKLQGLSQPPLQASALEQTAQAEAELAKGLRCLAWAQEAGFDPPELLVEAAACFQASLRSAAQHIPALLGLAYLQLLSEDYPGAQDCLERISEIQPTHSDLKNWKRFLLETPQDHSLEENESPSSESNIEWLYDETERYIDQAFQRFSQRVVLKPTLESAELAQLEEQATSLEEIRAHVQNTILVLDSDMDTTALCLRMEPLDLLVQGLDEVLKASFALLDLRNQIALLEKNLNGLLDRAGRMPAPVERAEIEFKLDEALDRSDRLQNQLHECAKRNWPSEALKRGLDKTQFLVEILQELLDSQR